MDFAINWVVWLGDKLNSTYYDELAALGFLFVACVAGMFIVGMAFNDGVIKPWRNGKAAGRNPCYNDGNEETQRGG